MADVSFIKGQTVRIFKDGVYIGTATAITNETTQEVTSREYIGDEDVITVAGLKRYEGSLTRDLTDEGFLEHIIGKSVSTKFAATNYEDDPDDVKGTVDSVTDVDSVAFLTPDKPGLTVQAITINGIRNGSFAGGLNIEFWEGTAGLGTLKGTVTINAGDLPTGDNEYLTVYIHGEASEFTVTGNTSHQLRLTAAGAPTGSFDVYGPTAAADFYFSIEYETTSVENSDYVIDTVMLDKNNQEVVVIRDTNVTFLNNNLTINPSEPISEATGWVAKKRQLL